VGLEPLRTERLGATADEIATAAAFLLGPDVGFITGTDLLIDGGVIAALRAGRSNLTLRYPADRRGSAAARSPCTPRTPTGFQ